MFKSINELVRKEKKTVIQSMQLVLDTKGSRHKTLQIHVETNLIQMILRAREA